jgi:hypothetical protein
MRARNREVNIFNMSLLDILTGMLGAFLFLMLGLVPYYTRAKNQTNPDNTPQAPRINNMLTLIVQGENNVTPNYYLLDPREGWLGASDKKNPFPPGTKVEAGACSAAPGWQNLSTWAYGENRYLVVYWLPKGTDPKIAGRTTFSVNLTTTQIDLTTEAKDSFSPTLICGTINATKAEAGKAYAAFWVHVTEDDSKQKYFLKYSLTLDDITAKDKLPPGLAVAPDPWEAIPPP